MGPSGYIMNSDTATHILLVDDEPIVLATLSTGLGALGYRVSQYEHPQTALDNYESDAPDIAIVDYNMPGMNGLELLQKMNAIMHRPMIMLSAYNDLPIVREAIGAGVSGYLVKPVESERLVPTIEASLARFNELSALLKQGADIQAGVESHRLISTAVGIVMARTDLTQDQAFENLRRLSRDRRRPLRELAFELVDAASTANAILQELRSSAVGK